jgi:hypothetical protein
MVLAIVYNYVLVAFPFLPHFSFTITFGHIQLPFAYIRVAQFVSTKAWMRIRNCWVWFGWGKVL